MLKVPKLDDLSYRQIFEQARSLIPTYTQEWTDYNDSDPGIAMLQVFAWLTDTLNFYLDSTGDAHRLKYLKLLGIRPVASPASSLLAVSGNAKVLSVPCGARFAAGDVVFESTESLHGAANRLAHVYAEADGCVTDLTRFAGMDGDWAQIFYGESPILYLGFEAPVSGTVSFHVQVCGEMNRNPFAHGFSPVQLRWEYFDGSRWQFAQCTADETGGFLRDGFITLHLDGTCAAFENPLMEHACYLRCAVTEGTYDVLPRLGRVTMNCLHIAQTDTDMRTQEFFYEGAAIVPDFYISESDFLVVAVGDGAEYTAWYEFEQTKDSLCEVRQGEYAWQRTVVFDAQRFGALPDIGAKVLVMVISSAMVGETVIGATNGCAGQRFSLPVENVHHLRLALTSQRDGRTVYRLFEDAHGTLSQSNGSACLFEREGQEIVFGDSIHGVQPERGWSVEIVALSRSKLDGGNVRKGAVTRILSELETVAAVENLIEASGGKRCEKPDDLERQVEEKLRAVHRAASREDYRQIVKNTPGLLIDSVNVISMQEYRAVYPDEPEVPNMVLLAVKPRAEEPRPNLSEEYRRFILAHLERYRLLTVRVKVIAARYVAVTAYGRIALREDTLAARQAVETAIFRLVQPEVPQFGCKVDFGRIFSTLEMMSAVRKVSRFSLEYEGAGGRKEENGDITIFPDAMAWLAGFGIEYI